MTKIKFQDIEKDVVEPIVQNFAVDNYYTIDHSELPSKGIFYDPDIKIKARPLNVREVKKLASMNENNAFDIMDEVISMCVKNINVYDMIEDDKYYFIFWLRANTYKDSGYTIKYSCPHCNAESSFSFNVESFIIDFIDEELCKDMTRTLPHSNLKVEFKIPKVSDDIYMRNVMKRIKYEFEPDLLALVKRISSIEGVSNDFMQMYKFIENDLHPIDYSYLIRELGGIVFGINNYINAKCKTCKEESQQGIQFQSEFFIPEIGVE